MRQDDLLVMASCGGDDAEMVVSLRGGSDLNFGPAIVNAWNVSSSKWSIDVTRGVIISAPFIK